MSAISIQDQLHAPILVGLGAVLDADDGDVGRGNVEKDAGLGDPVLGRLVSPRAVSVLELRADGYSTGEKTGNLNDARTGRDLLGNVIERGRVGAAGNDVAE